MPEKITVNSPEGGVIALSYYLIKSLSAKLFFDYLENGNIVNSVNLPCVSKDKTGGTRVCVIAKADVNVEDVKKATGSDDCAVGTRGDYCYMIIDNATSSQVDVEGVIRVRTV